MPLTGAVFVVLLVLAFVIGGETPDADDSAAEAVSFYTDNDSEQIASALLGAYAVVFFLFFAGFLRAALRKGEESGILSTVSFAGAIVLGLGGLFFSGLTFTLADTADSLDPSAVQALSALNSDFFLPLAVGNGVFMIANGMAIVRRPALPAWLGWAAIVIGVLGITPVGFFAFLVTMLWVLVVSIMLTLRARAPAAGAPGP
jgi:hypothetical protein